MGRRGRGKEAKENLRDVQGSSETKGISDKETRGRRDRACWGWTGKQEEMLEGSTHPVG